jgi:hypothetical protein
VKGVITMTKEKEAQNDAQVEIPVYDFVTAAQAGELCGKSAGFFAGRAKRGATMPPIHAAVGRSVLYKRAEVLEGWETAKHEKVSRGRRSNLPEGVKSRASVMMLDEEWEKVAAVKGDLTIVDFVRKCVCDAIGIEA